jgi:hypothetical protein
LRTHSGRFLRRSRSRRGERRLSRRHDRICACFNVLDYYLKRLRSYHPFPVVLQPYNKRAGSRLTDRKTVHFARYLLFRVRLEGELSLGYIDEGLTIRVKQQSLVREFLSLIVLFLLPNSEHRPALRDYRILRHRPHFTRNNPNNFVEQADERCHPVSVDDDRVANGKEQQLWHFSGHPCEPGM